MKNRRSSESSEQSQSNDGHQFDRLPANADTRVVDQRPTRKEVIHWWKDTYGIKLSVWDQFTFWEKGNGKLWVCADNLQAPMEIEALGLRILRTRQNHWKPSTNAVQRFGHLATKRRITLTRKEAEQFVAGNDQSLPCWDGEWGYLIVEHEYAGISAPIGVGLYLHGELRSTVPKTRQIPLS